MRRLPVRVAIGVLAAVSGVAPVRAADFLVHNAAEVTAAVGNTQPGDTITMADGLWTNQVITFGDAGTAAKPITLRAQTPGRVILNGASRLIITGDYCVANGLTFKDGALTDDQVISITSAASFSRVTNSAIIDYNPPTNATGYGWVRVDGVQNRVDHNFFAGKNNPGVLLEVFPSVGSKHQVDNNHFVDFAHGNSNGWECIRIGLSSVQTRSAEALVERNLFERVDGELETISVKSSNNTLRDNTFRECNGTLTLRHGQGSLVEGNFFLGNNKAGSGGIRVIGPNHVVQNNYFSDLDTNALSITTGMSDFNTTTNATDYEPVSNVLIAHNTVVNVTDQIVTRDAGYTSDPLSTRNVRPANVTMANNILYSTSEQLIQGTEGPNWTWAGNMAFGATVGKSGSGILNVNPVLVKDASGIWRPAANSPAINAAVVGPWPYATHDMDGQMRIAPSDIGADEASNFAKTAGPLSGSDVGPAWLTRRTIDLGKYGVPVLIMEAEKYTTLKDPNGNGLTWDVVEDPLTSGGAFLKAPAGTRTDVPAMTQDALAEYDVAFHDPGTYFLYVLSRGPNTGANSLYSPVNLGDDPTVNETVPGDNKWSWTELGSYTILAADVNRPLTLGIGRREGGVEIDKFLLSPVQLTLSVPEPSLSLSALLGGVTLLGRRRRPGRGRMRSCRLRLD